MGEPQTLETSSVIKPGALFRAHENTRLDHSTPPGYTVLLMSWEGEMHEGERLYRAAVLGYRYWGFAPHPTGYTASDLNRFTYIGNLFDLTDAPAAPHDQTPTEE